MLVSQIDRRREQELTKLSNEPLNIYDEGVDSEEDRDSMEVDEDNEEMFDDEDEEEDPEMEVDHDDAEADSGAESD